MNRWINKKSSFQGCYETMTCKEFIKIHHDIVRQVSYVDTINSFISSAESFVINSPSVIIASLGVQEARIVIRMNGVREA